MTPNSTPPASTRQERDSLALLIGEMSDGALIARSGDGVILAVNRKLCQMLSLTADSIVGLDARGQLPLVEFGSSQGESIHRECKIPRSDGATLRTDISVTPLPDGKVLVILRESADRRSHKSSSSEDLMFRALFCAAPLPMFILDRESLRILDVNDSAMETYGYDREHFLRLHLADLSPVEDVPRLLIRWSMATPEAHELGEWRHFTKSGQGLSVRLIARSTQAGGRNRVVLISLPLDQQNLPITPSEPVTDVTKAILDVISSPTIVTDPAGRLRSEEHTS